MDKLLNSAEIRDFINNNFIVIRTLYNSKTGIDLKNRYGVKTAPILVSINSDGEQIDQIPGFFSKLEDLKGKLDASLSGETLYAYRKAYEADPANLLNIYNLAYKLYDNSNGESDEALKMLNVVLNRSEEAAEITVQSDLYNVGTIDISMLEHTEYLIAFSGYIKNRTRDVTKFVAFIEKYPDSYYAGNAYRLFSRGKGIDEVTRYSLLRKAVDRFPEDKSHLNNFMNYALKNPDHIDEAIKLAETSKFTKRISNGYTIDIYAKLLAEQGDIEKLNKVYGKEYYTASINSITRDLRRYVNFWKDRDDAPVDVLEVAEKMYGLNPDIGIRAQYVNLLLKRGITGKISEVMGEEYLETIWDNPGHLEMFTNFWTDRGEYLDLGLKACSRLLELSPENAASWMVMSSVYRKRKEYMKAIEAIQKSIEINPDAEYYKKRLADIKADMEKAKKGK